MANYKELSPFGKFMLKAKGYIFYTIRGRMLDNWEAFEMTKAKYSVLDIINGECDGVVTGVDTSYKHFMINHSNK